MSPPPSMDWATRAIEAWRALQTACIRESEALEVLEGRFIEAPERIVQQDQVGHIGTA